MGRPLKVNNVESMIQRRTFLRGTAAFLGGVLAGDASAQVMNTRTDTSSVDAITDVVGVKIGHFTDSRKPTGCTVLLTEEGAVGAVDVRGAAPGTRETDLLNPVNLVEKVHAIVLSGGSAFGLDTATGVMGYLEERNIGFDVGVARVPIVPAAILFDLAVGDPKIRPNAESGRPRGETLYSLQLGGSIHSVAMRPSASTWRSRRQQVTYLSLRYHESPPPSLTRGVRVLCETCARTDVLS